MAHLGIKVFPETYFKLNTGDMGVHELPFGALVGTTPPPTIYQYGVAAPHNREVI